jgi:PAS domain-containing protein
LAKEKGIGIKDLTEAILLLHRFTLTFLRANYSHDFNRIHDCFDTILLLIIQSYEEITSRNFHNQLAAINKSNILIKIDPRGRISYANEAYLKLSQYHLDELI